MLDRTYPLVILLLHRLLTSLAPLLVLVLSGAEEAPPPLGVYLGAVAIWTVPDLVTVQRNSRTETRAPLVYRALISALRIGYLTLLVGLGLGFALQAVFKGPAWWAVGFGAWFLALVAEQAHLRRSVDRLVVLER